MALLGQVESYRPELMSAKVLAICLPAFRWGLGRRICQFVKSVMVMVLP